MPDFFLPYADNSISWLGLMHALGYGWLDEMLLVPATPFPWKLVPDQHFSS